MARDIDHDDDLPVDAEGGIHMERLLAKLLRACGVALPSDVDEGNFKQELYRAAMEKIMQLTGGHRAGVDRTNGKARNPLIEGAESGKSKTDQMVDALNAELPPLYMALSVEGDTLRRQNAQVAETLARQTPAALTTQEEAALVGSMVKMMGGEQGQADVSVVRNDVAPVVVDSLRAENRDLLRRLHLLGVTVEEGVRLSLGEAEDPAETNRRLRDRLAQCPVGLSYGTDLDAAEAALCRRMGVG